MTRPVKCDVCGIELRVPQATFLGASQMRDAVEHGYVAGVPGVEVARWKQQVAEDVSDWCLCDRCYSVVRTFVPEDPAPLGVTEAQVSVAGTRTVEPTVLQELIDAGVYRASAGQEPIGYFDPSCAPFQIFASRVAVNEAAARAMAGRLGAGSAQEVMEIFETVLAHRLLQEFLMQTTIEPFFLRYGIARPVAIFEVARELQFNALAALLLVHPALAGVESPADFANALAEVMANEANGQ